MNRLGLVFIVLGLTITTVACSSKKTADLITGADNPSVITSPQPKNTQATPSPSPTAKPSSKITSGDQAGELVKKTIFNNNDGIVMAYKTL